MIMRALWDTARGYGLPTLFTHKDGTYSCTIRFSTISNIELEAKSGYMHIDPEVAISKAIENAKIIARDLAAQSNNLKQLEGK
jgi:pyrrolidone-carboxylate peptidase